MAEQDYSYIFRCTDKTEQECFDLMLFAENKRFYNGIKGVKKGDILFLYNIDKVRLYGPFIADSDCGENIIPGAWGGKFPYQVKIKKGREYSPLEKYDLEKVLSFRYLSSGKLYLLDMKIDLETQKKLMVLFQSNQRESIVFKTSTLEIPPIRTDDGHFVRSVWEQRVDNWLYEHNIPHTYEKRLNVDENLYYDFFIKKGAKNNTEDIYIELWGKGDKEYLARKERKLEIYKKYNIKPVELVPEDMKDLNKAMTDKLNTLI